MWWLWLEVMKTLVCLWLVLALLRRHEIHTKEAPDQHAGSWEQRSGQTKVSSVAQDQRILGNSPKPQRNRWVSSVWWDLLSMSTSRYQILRVSWMFKCCCVCCAAAAVYDSTLNFRNNETPTLLGILHGKKYHADLYVRYKDVFCCETLHFKFNSPFCWTYLGFIYDPTAFYVQENPFGVDPGRWGRVRCLAP